MRATPLLLLATLVAGCAATEDLSKSIYDHQQRAFVLEATGQMVEAAAYRQQAARERDRLAARERHVLSPTLW